MDQVIATLADDTEVGPQLRALGTPVEITYKDFDITVNIRAGEEGESNLVWVWSKRVKWDPTTRIEVNSDVANQFMQGKLQVARALALRKVKVRGSLTAGLRIVAISGPAFDHYRERVENDYPHLVV
ncbi:MAG: hypothetical protein ACSLFF_04800 [Solirubrobacterales bacterium]